MLAVPFQQPGVWIDLARHRGQWGEIRECLEWRAIATTECLVGSFAVVVFAEAGGDFPCLLKRPGAINQQTFFFVGAIKPLHKPVLLGMMRITHLDIDVQTGTGAESGRRKVAALGAANQSGISIHGDAIRPSMRLEGLPERSDGRFCGKVRTDMCSDDHRCTHVNNIEGLRAMLFFAVGISWHTGNILVIDLPMRHGLRPLHGLALAWFARHNPLMLEQNLINRACGARSCQSERLEGFVSLEIILDSPRPRRASQAFRGVISNGQDGLFHQRVQPRRRMVGRS
jgi:hypothetical protein